ncbi:MAG: GxxExxY protein [Sumerlaeia bacterium]
MLIVELKSVKSINPAHEAQLVNYLVATGKDIGLLINWAELKVQIKRKTRLLYQQKT